MVLPDQLEDLFCIQAVEQSLEGVDLPRSLKTLSLREAVLRSREQGTRCIWGHENVRKSARVAGFLQPVIGTCVPHLGGKLADWGGKVACLAPGVAG